MADIAMDVDQGRPLDANSNSESSLQNMAQSKYTSPSPPVSSFTPPPSSQPPPLRHVPGSSDSVIDDTPTPSQLSSPPPTTARTGPKRDHRSSLYVEDEFSRSLNTYEKPTGQEIADASASQLRDMLRASISEVDRLGADLVETRMTAAHHKLQHNLLLIETEETAKRMEVEHAMTRREVEVLQHAENARQAQTGSDGQSVVARYAIELKEHCQVLDSELTLLHRRLHKAKKLIIQKDDELKLLGDENVLLLKRIRENREHLKHLRSPGGIYAPNTPHTANTSAPYTPQQQYRGTPRQTPGTGRSHHPRDGEQDAFAALILADQVLSQENTGSAPTTPRNPQRVLYQRHQASYSQGHIPQVRHPLPTTPVRGEASSRGQSKNILLPPVQFSPRDDPHHRTIPPHSQHTYPRTSPQQQRQEREHRRKSRDSTISESDGEGRTTHINTQDQDAEATDDEIEESQASQSATSMLRADPRKSMDVLPSPTTEKSGLLQAKLFGSLSKPGVEKRKGGGEGPSPKKMRTAEGVGLGIGIPLEPR